MIKVNANEMTFFVKIQHNTSYDFFGVDTYIRLCLVISWIV